MECIINKDKTMSILKKQDFTTEYLHILEKFDEGVD